MGLKLATTEPRIQSGLRYTAEGSDPRETTCSYSLRRSRGLRAGDPLQGRSPDRPEGMRITCILKLSDSVGELTLNSLTQVTSHDWNSGISRLSGTVNVCARQNHLSLQFLEHPAFKAIVERRISPSDSDPRDQ
ncbi:MAG: hypothetical protein Ct9H300mP11_00880 [Chloroflexota bacterium]|nr:MAG: hypothetical protein Ct9H300mP11_00880 [Chloroflexota bacterium]